MRGVVRKTAIASVLLVALLGAAGCGSSDDATDDPEKAVFGVPEESPSDDAPPKAGEPTKLRVPALDLVAPVDPVENEDGVLTPPADADRAGWWSDGPRPGDRSGRILIAGHTLSDGGGAFEELGTLSEGDRVSLTASTGKFAYRIKSIKHLSVDEVAEKSPRIFRTSGPERLVLVTCEDWDGEEYLANTIVIATPV